MGFDQITWSPAIGGSGDDLYNIPGATKIDLTLDTTSGPCGVDVGDDSGFSVIPTIAQLNASSGINQLIGLYNRRAGNYNSLFGTSLTILSYVTSGKRPDHNDITNLFTQITNLRNQEGFTAAIAWPGANPAASRPIRGWHIAYLRKALAISGSMTLQGAAPSQSKFWTYLRTDNPYNTHISETITLLGAGALGKTFSGANSQRLRQIFAFNIPDWLTAAPSVAEITTQFSFATTTLESFNVPIYSYNTDPGTPNLGTGYNGTFYNPDTNEGTLSANTLLQTLAVATTPITNNAGAHYAVLAVSNTEYANGGADPGAAGKSADVGAGNISLLLTI